MVRRFFKFTAPMAMIVGTLGLILAAPALAYDLNASVAIDQDAPYPGESVTYTVSVSGGTPPYNYAFDVNGDETYEQNGPSPTFTTSFATTGVHEIGIFVLDSVVDGGSAFLQPQVTVVAPLAGSIAASSDSPGAGDQVSLSANVTGGKLPYSYAWDLDGDGQFADGSGATVSTSFQSQGSKQVSVRVTDSASRAHAETFAKTINVGPPCRSEVAFGLVEMVANQGVCIRTIASGGVTRYEADGAVKFNGIPIPKPPGNAKTTLKVPTSDAPGGRLSASGVEIKLGNFVAYRGDIDWKLPEGSKGDEAKVAQLTVPSGAASVLFGLDVDGSIALKLGYRADGTRYATFPLNINLPSIFKTGPNKESGGATGTGALRVDRYGIHYDGLKLQVSNVWVGKLRVEQVCFSFVPRGSQAVEPCEAPSLDGRPYITCNEDVNTDRWDGNAVLILPTTAQTRLAMFGGVANNRLSKLGGFVDNLGNTVPITESVYLNRVGIGLCVYPPPFKLRGDVGLSVWPTPAGKETLAVNGYFIYTDAYQSNPWSIEMGGSVEIYDKLIGSGFVILRPTGSFDFGVNSGFSIASVVSINGRLSGWLETRLKRFNIDGSIRSCLQSLCAGADAVLSSVGVAGCLDAGRIVYWVLVKNRDWTPLKWWRVHWERREIQLKAGFGHRWANRGVDLFGGSCYLENYRAVRAALGAAAGAAAASDRFTVRRGEQALALRIRGKGAPPKVKLTAPDGSTISSPAAASSAQQKGRYMLVENPPDGSTSVLLVKPKPGIWKVEAQSGSEIAGIDSAGFDAPASVVGAVRNRSRRGRTLRLAYALPRGTKMSLVERGRQVARTIASDVKGRPCPRNGGAPGRSGRLCARIDFRASFGPAGKRRISAVITRAGLSIDTIHVTSFRAPRPARPTKPRDLRLSRGRNGVVVRWRPDTDVFQYALEIEVSDGRRLSFVPGAECRGFRVSGIAPSLAVRAKLAGIRMDTVTGPYAQASLRAGKPPKRVRLGNPRRRACS